MLALTAETQLVSLYAVLHVNLQNLACVAAVASDMVQARAVRRHSGGCSS